MADKYLALKGEKFDINKVTVVGSPTITEDGVASGFSSSNYLQANYSFDVTNAKTWEIKCKFNTNDFSTAQSVFGFSNAYWANTCSINTSKNIRFFLAVGSNSTVVKNLGADKCYISAGVDNYLYLKFDGNKYEIGISQDGINYDTDSYISSEPLYIHSSLASSYIQIGRYGGQANTPFLGSIDLTAFKIYVDGKLVYTPTEPTYLLERRKPKVWNKGQFNIVGSPVITDDGVATYITGQNYVYIPPIDYTKPFAIKKIGFTQASAGGNCYFINGANTTSDFGGFVIGFNGSNRKLRMFLGSTGTSWDIASGRESSTILELNKPYYVDLIYNGTNYVFILYDFSLKELERITVNNSTPLYNSQQGIMIGANFISSTVYNGNIFLNKFVVENDGVVVFDGSEQTYIYDPSKFTVVGTPTITEYGVASGFSSSNYLQANYSFDVTNAKTWEINCVAKATEITRNGFAVFEIYNGATECALIALRNDSTNNYIYFALKDSGSNGEYLYFGDYLRNYGVVSVNVNYFFKLRFTGSEYLLSVSTDGENYTVIKQISNSTSLGNGKDIFLGLRKLNNVTDQGSIDLTQFSITVDGKEVFTGAKVGYYVLRR